MNPAHRRLDAFIGGWDVAVIVDGDEIAAGHTTFRWSEGQTFVLQRHQAGGSEGDSPDVPPEWRDNAPTSTDVVLGFDDGSERFAQLYADSRGVFRIYQMTLADGRWELWRDHPGFSQRFIADFTDDGRTINGRWEKSFDGEDWSLDFHVVYTKVG